MPTDREFHEWSKLITEQLATLNVRYETLSNELINQTLLLQKGMAEQRERIENKLDGINHLITGNGTPERGVIVRLDRLEQTEKRRSWLTRTAIGAAIASLISTLLALWK